MKIRVIIADDHQIVRQGLRSLLENQPDIEVIAEASDGQEVVRLAQEMSPDVVVMDVAMPNLNGIEATRQIVARVPGAKVISLSMYADSRFVSRMLEAGACGYVLKDCAFEELNQAINIVVANQIYLSPKIAGMVVKDYIHQLQEDKPSPFSVLTPRERATLQLMVEGKTTKEIASNLSVSVKTIESYRKEIMDKLDIHSIAELTKYAIREGLTSL
ncbi:MAG: response regulator transcription factor [Dehalococcoidia bacterium]